MSVARLVTGFVYFAQRTGIHRVRAQYGVGQLAHHAAASAAERAKPDHRRGNVPRRHLNHNGVRPELFGIRRTTANGNLGG